MIAIALAGKKFGGCGVKNNMFTVKIKNFHTGYYGIFYANTDELASDRDLDKYGTYLKGNDFGYSHIAQEVCSTMNANYDS